MDVTKKNILYISYDGMTDALGQSQVLPYLFGLSKENYNIHLISFEKKDKYIEIGEEISNICKINKINWHPQYYTKNPPVLSTIWDFYRMKKLAEKLQKKFKFDVVHCRSYLPAMAGMNLKKKYGTKFLFDMRGFWADERVDGGQWDLNKFIFKKIFQYFKRKELDLFSNCDECVSLTENGKIELLSWKLNRKNKLKVNVIPCCVDLTHFNYENTDNNDQLKYIQKYNIEKNDLVICYLGSLGTVYLFDEVLKTVSLIENKHPNFKFLIFTQENKNLVSNYISNSPIKNTKNVFIDSLQRKEVPMAISLCSFSIFFCKPTYPRKGTSPTRLAELIACGVKIISNKGIGDSEFQIKENNLGYVFEDFSEVSYKDFIDNFNFDENFSKKELRKVANELFSLEHGIKKYKEIYLRLTQN